METTVTPMLPLRLGHGPMGTTDSWSQYSPGSLEFSLLDRVPLPQGGFGLRWGGAGVYRGSPEHGAWLRPGETHRFGVTRITAYDGDWQQGFYTFRTEMEKRGHGRPAGFNPPVH